MYQSVTVFCGSQLGKNSLYQQQAEALGKALAQHNIHLDLWWRQQRFDGRACQCNVAAWR